MLSLSGPETRFDLDIAGYQFPSAPGGDYDSAWLRVQGNVQSGQLVWKFDDPCILTSELVSLADWLARVPVMLRGSELEFLEPNLRFAWLFENGQGVLSVYFSQHTAPPGASEDERFGDGYAIRFPVDCIDFAAASLAVREICRKFPNRD